MKKINLFIFALFFTLGAFAQATSNFDTLTLGTDTFWTGSTLTGGFADGHAYFENVYDAAYGGYWSAGFVYSDKTDSVTSGYTNPGSAITASGFNGSKNYAVAYDDGGGNVKVRLTQTAAGRAVQGCYVTNTTYAYLSMLYGDMFEHPFAAGYSDFFLLNITGWKGGQPVGDTVKFYLASFLSDDTTQNYILKNWHWVNLLSLGNVDSLVFSLSSSQYDSLGYLTPTYFALDNFVTSDLSVLRDTVLYNQDTLLNVLSGVLDTAGGPFTVEVVSRTIPGSTVVDSNNLIWYIPQDGIVGFDTLVYAICNASNVCDTSEIIIDVRSPTGIRNINNLQTKVYPNPCGSSCSLYHSGEIKTVELFDLEGRLIRTIPCNTGEHVTEIQTSDLEAGTYVVRAVSDQGVGIAKVVKQ